MCYFNGQKITQAEWLRLKQIEKELAVLQLRQQPVIPGFENRVSHILLPNADRTDFEVVEASWVFVPSSVQGTNELTQFRQKYDTLVARGETVLQSPLYREAALSSRCLVLSTGFFEHRHLPQVGRNGEPLKTTDKIPYRIRVKGQEYFYLAGLHNRWLDKEIYESFDTFSILTTDANLLMAQIHNTKRRMPVVLTEELAWEWLLGEPNEERIAEIARFQIPSAELEAYPVSKDFIATQNIERKYYHHLPSLAA